MRLSPFTALDSALAPAPDVQRVGWLKQWVFAHRGWHGDSAGNGRGRGVQRIENAPSAFRAAIDAGVGIECDIQRSADGVPMVFHDWDFRRLIGRPDRTDALTAAEWRKLSYLEGEDAPIALDDLLALVAGQVPLLIELKSRPRFDIETTCLKVRDALAEYRGHHAVMSFDPRVSRWLRHNSPHTVRGLVVREDEHGFTRKGWQRRLALWTAKPDFVAYHIAALPSTWVAELRDRGMPVLTWTVKGEDDRRRARACADAPIFEGPLPQDVAA